MRKARTSGTAAERGFETAILASDLIAAFNGLMPTIALIRDLMFASKVTATARSLGVAVRIVRDPRALPEATQLLVDLNQPDALEAAATWRLAGQGRTVIGFVSHVDIETIARAKSAGIDRVLARSAFVDQLEAMLKPESAA